MDTDKIIDLFKSMTTAKKKQFDDENVRVDKATVISSKKIFEINGQSRYYSRNEDLIHETNFEKIFTDYFFGIRVNEHFTSQHCYRINPEK